MTRGETELRKAMAEHPDLPLMANCPSLPSDYDNYWLDVVGVRIESILKPAEVNRQWGDYFGLADDRYYWDDDDAIDAVSDWLFNGWYDEARIHGMAYYPWRTHDPSPSDVLTDFCGAESDIGYFADSLARSLVREMPWQDYIVIDCC